MSGRPENEQQPTLLWLNGPSRSGKTAILVERFATWSQARPQRTPSFSPGALVLAANRDNQRQLADRLVAAVGGRYPAAVKTLLGFATDEVLLFWPLLFERLGLRAQFPLRLRPETEQELAARLWHAAWEPAEIPNPAAEARLVRTTLDLLQLAGASGTPVADIPALLARGFASGILDSGGGIPLGAGTAFWEKLGHLLQQWQQWCLERGLLGYGLIYALYSRELLQDPAYLARLHSRYGAIFADDLDDYPAIAADLCEILIDGGMPGTFTFNPDGCIRLGLNADPARLEGLAARCTVRELLRATPPAGAEATPGDLASVAVPLAIAPTYERWLLPPAIRLIQTDSRAALLRRTAETIVAAIRGGEVEPGEVVAIAPGLDEIGRYTLGKILREQKIPVRPLNEQRSLASSPLVRALLTLLALVFPGLGELVDRDGVAEMLVMLGREQGSDDRVATAIDPVRAGLLADYCYVPDRASPQLLAATAFPRWDRLGYRASRAYERIRTWLEAERQRQQRRALPNAIASLDGAIAQFFWGGSDLSFAGLSALRELMETAQHYWEVRRRLHQSDASAIEPLQAVGAFIQLLRQGTISANAYPENDFATARPAVLLSNIFQYRSLRQHHRWQFWLDAGSPLWLKGGAADLFGSALFRQDWSGQPLQLEDFLIGDRQRLARILRDLLARADDRVYLCHSDLAIDGTEQTGPLLNLVYAVSLESELSEKRTNAT